MEGQQAVQTNWELIIEPMESGKKGYALKDGVHWECFRKDSKGKRDSGANNKNLYKKHQKVADCMRYFQRQRQQCFTIWIHDSALCGSGTKSILQSEMPRMWLPTRNKLSTNTIYSVYDKFKFSVEVRTWSVKLTEKLRKKKTPSETIENGPKSNEECVYGFEVLPFFTAQEISMIKDDDSAFRMYLQNVMKSIAIKSGQGNILSLCV